MKCSLFVVNDFVEYNSFILPKSAMLIELQFIDSNLLIKKSFSTQFSPLILTHIPKTHVLI